MSKNREINYTAVNPTDIKANIHGTSHDPNHLFTDKEKNFFSAPSDFEKSNIALVRKKKSKLQKTPLSTPDYRNENLCLYVKTF